MAEPKSRATSTRESATQSREQVDRQRDSAPRRGEHDLPQPSGGHSSKTMSDPDVVLQIPQAKVEQLYVESLVRTVDSAVNQVGRTAEQVLGPQGPLSQTLEQTSQQVGQQLGQATRQLAQNGEAAAGDGGRSGVPGGSLARAAWQRMKKVVDNNQPLRQITMRLVGPQGHPQD
ncbi:hypothetical protein O7598_12945 [Micromonospora sp. WMMC241]|uniref:hypothetical protein n=1 Tax=Micromonospora sp. WMMC241 TaxID=3015159 RepID=UPI0022B6CC86|nr:hypothetical protein [Micromonospora sp. WMMC241]MCZ7437306.1 hypothetical protein [Micromonospora sp. WMMC241]